MESGVHNRKKKQKMKKTILCAYYFPNWHVDERNEKLHGKGWTEWRVVQHATPRFEGHEQPKIPLWGYEDESSPAVMAKKIAAASEHGIDAFVFDYYWFFDGSYRERCLLEGFLPAPNRLDIQFALMWANHNPIYAHPGSYRKPGEPLWSGEVSPETFLTCTDHLIETYLNQPNYLRVRGKLYFSFFQPAKLIRQFGRWRVAKILFADFRHRVEQAGLGELNLDAILDDFGDREHLENADAQLRQAGFDSCSNYSNLRGNDFPAFKHFALTAAIRTIPRTNLAQICFAAILATTAKILLTPPV